MNAVCTFGLRLSAGFKIVKVHCSNTANCILLWKIRDRKWAPRTINSLCYHFHHLCFNTRSAADGVWKKPAQTNPFLCFISKTFQMQQFCFVSQQQKSRSTCLNKETDPSPARWCRCRLGNNMFLLWYFQHHNNIWPFQGKFCFYTTLKTVSWFWSWFVSSGDSLASVHRRFWLAQRWDEPTRSQLFSLLVFC